MSGEEVGRTWKMYGFWGGPLILDAVLKHFAQRGKPDYGYLLQEPSIKDAPQGHRSLERAIRLQILPKNDPKVQLQLIQLHLELIEKERIARTRDGAKQQAEDLEEFYEYADAVIVNFLAEKRAQAAATGGLAKPSKSACDKVA
jgi:hypothetical protein